MRSYSELLDQQIRGENNTLNPNNKVTKRRRNALKKIYEQAQGKDEAAYQLSMQAIEDNIPRLQEYVLSHSEEPAPNVNDLVDQVFQLRMQEAQDASEIMDYSIDDSLVHLDQQESDYFDDHGHIDDSFLGELFTPISIAHAYKNKPDGLDSGVGGGGILAQLGAGLGSLVTNKLNASELKNAAQGKKAGVVGTLASGGVTHYNSLVAYFKAHPQVAEQVIKGSIISEDQLPGYNGLNTINDSPFQNIIDNTKQGFLKTYLPYIIAFFVLLIIIVIVAARMGKKK